MRYSRFVSAFLPVLLASCARDPYRNLNSSAPVDDRSRGILSAPAFSRELYRCAVDGGFLFRKYHLSGVLLLKAFDDGTERVVFQNELGISFFNFRWDARDSFSVTSIMPQLDRAAIIRTLRTDFELLLRKQIDTVGAKLTRGRGLEAVIVTKNAGRASYATDARTIVYGGRSLVTTIRIDSPGRGGSLPEHLRILHHKARFTIDLKRIPPDDN